MTERTASCPPSVPSCLLTIGYEGASLESFIRTLHEAAVSVLADIRAVPSSRRPGFSKAALAEALAVAGVAYRHLPELGNPKPGRDAARAGRLANYRAIYAGQLATPAAASALDTLAALAAETRICLMCYERQPRDCHRSLVVEALRPRLAEDAIHLAPGLEAPGR